MLTCRLITDLRDYRGPSATAFDQLDSCILFRTSPGFRAITGRALPGGNEKLRGGKCCKCLDTSAQTSLHSALTGVSSRVLRFAALASPPANSGGYRLKESEYAQNSKSNP